MKSNEELRQHVRNLIRDVQRQYYRPPNPNRVTPWAYATCCEHLIDDSQLYEALLRDGAGYSEAYRAIYGPFPDELFPDDWVGLVRYLHQQFPLMPLERLASYVSGWHGGQCVSTVRRVLDETGELKRQQSEYQKRYCQRHPERRARTQADYYARNSERLRAARRERYRQQDQRSRRTDEASG